MRRHSGAGRCLRLLAAAAAIYLLCSCSDPSSGQHSKRSVVPEATRQLFAGTTLYALAGPNASSLNVWTVSATGRIRRLTHNKPGYGISSFVASAAGVVLNDAASGVDELTRLTGGKAVRMPEGHVEACALDDAGNLAYVRPPDDPGYGKYFQLDIAALTKSAKFVVIRQKNELNACAWGPHHQLAVISAAGPDGGPEAMNIFHLPSRQPSPPPGNVQHPFNVVWSPDAYGMALASNTGCSVITADGDTLTLPQGWYPSAWSPSGQKLLLLSGKGIGIWSPAQPSAVRLIIPEHTFGSDIHIFGTSWTTRHH